jgi:hypothetical protein
MKKNETSFVKIADVSFDIMQLKKQKIAVQKS